MLGGGRQLRSARIRFVEDVPHWASIVATGDIGAVAPKLHDVVIDWAESHTVRGLKFGSTYRDVTVQAINDKGDTSNPSNLLESVDTMAGTAEQQLRWRIAHAAAEQDDPVDVVYQGFYQRMKKSVYIQALQKELAALGADPEASEVHCETRLGASASEAQQQPVRLKKQRDPDHRSSDLELPPSIRNMTRMRRKHFRLKIEGLEGAIRTAEGAVTELQMRRIRLRAALASSETRLRALKAERKNLASYKGKFVDSAVMHGRSHRHNTDELRAALEDELDKTMDDIALGKQVIIEGMQKEEATAEQVEGLQEQIRQRMAANHEFERSVARYAAQASSVARIVSSASVRAFNQWKEFRDMSKRAKATLLRLVNGALRGMMTEGFASWKRVVFKHRDAKARAEELDNSGAEIVGLGGRLLQKARTDRELAMADLTDMLSGLDHARQSADLAGRSRRQRELMFKAAAGSPLASATPAFSQLERWHMQAKRGGTRAMDPEAEPDGAASQSGSGLASLRKTHRLVAEEVEMLIAQGLALASDPSGDHAKAEQVLRRAEFAVREHGLAAPLARVYRGLTMIYMNADRWDLAAVHADRWNKAAKESDWSTEMLESLETWGRILRKWGHHDAAIVKLEAVLQEYEVLGDDIPVLRVLEELAELYLVTDRADQHAQLRRRAVMLESRDSKRLTDAIKQLQGLEGTLSGTQLKELSAVLLEPVSPIVPALRVQQSVLHSTEKTLKRLLKAAEEFRSARLGRKMLIERRLEQARISGGTVLDVAELDRAAREMARSKAADQKRAASSRRGASSSRPATASESRPATASGSRPATAGSERGSRPPSASGMRGQAIDRGQLMERLQKELDQIGLDVAESDSTLRRLSVRISNCQDDLGDVEDHMRAECNSLAQKVYGATPLRCVAFNEGNFVSNNVRGLGTGGVGKIATCMERVVMAFEMDTGYCTNGFSGASRETSVGPPLGHTSRVVSIAFSGRIIVSGATDWSVRVWDVDQQPLGQAAAGMADAATAAGDMAGMEQDADAVVARALRRAYGPSTGIPASTLPRMPPTHKHAPFQDSLRAAGCMLLLEGHTGAVWSVAVNDKVIVSGGADRRVLVWRLRDGRLLRKLRGHEATVRTISLEGHSFVSGSVEGELRLWDYEGDERNPAEHVTLRRRLIGHEASVTVSSMVGDEIVSGGSDGKVLVWNVDTGEPTRVFPLHRGAVTAMQFDAVKIVTAGTDLAVKVTDIISGRVLQEFASAHEAPVVALQFDLRNLMTASIDHIVKLWKWDDMKASSATREHILRAGEPIARVAKTYKVTIQQIMNWNNVSRLTGFYQGQRILVSEPPETAGMDTLGMVREGRSMLGDEIAEMRGVVQRGIITDKTVGGGVKRLLARAKGHADAAALL
jgi:tetratricopeptide (TPR) repeat protein